MNLFFLFCVVIIPQVLSQDQDLCDENICIDSSADLLGLPTLDFSEKQTVYIRDGEYALSAGLPLVFENQNRTGGVSEMITIAAYPDESVTIFIDSDDPFVVLHDKYWHFSNMNIVNRLGTNECMFEIYESAKFSGMDFDRVAGSGGEEEYCAITKSLTSGSASTDSDYFVVQNCVFRSKNKLIMDEKATDQSSEQQSPSSVLGNYEKALIESNVFYSTQMLIGGENYISIVANYFYDEDQNSYPLLTVKDSKNILLHNNIFYGSGSRSSTDGAVKFVGSYDDSLENIYFQNNLIQCEVLTDSTFFSVISHGGGDLYYKGLFIHNNLFSYRCGSAENLIYEENMECEKVSENYDSCEFMYNYIYGEASIEGSWQIEENQNEIIRLYSLGDKPTPYFCSKVEYDGEEQINSPTVDFEGALRNNSVEGTEYFAGPLICSGITQRKGVDEDEESFTTIFLAISLPLISICIILWVLSCCVGFAMCWIVIFKETNKKELKEIKEKAVEKIKQKNIVQRYAPILYQVNPEWRIEFDPSVYAGEKMDVTVPEMDQTELNEVPMESANNTNASAPEMPENMNKVPPPIPSRRMRRKAPIIYQPPFDPNADNIPVKVEQNTDVATSGSAPNEVSQPKPKPKPKDVKEIQLNDYKCCRRSFLCIFYRDFLKGSTRKETIPFLLFYIDEIIFTIIGYFMFLFCMISASTVYSSDPINTDACSLLNYGHWSLAYGIIFLITGFVGTCVVIYLSFCKTFKPKNKNYYYDQACVFVLIYVVKLVLMFSLLLISVTINYRSYKCYDNVVTSSIKNIFLALNILGYITIILWILPLIIKLIFGCNIACIFLGPFCESLRCDRIWDRCCCKACDKCGKECGLWFDSCIKDPCSGCNSMNCNDDDLRWMCIFCNLFMLDQRNCDCDFGNCDIDICDCFCDCDGNGKCDFCEGLDLNCNGNPDCDLGGCDLDCLNGCDFDLDCLNGCDFDCLCDGCNFLEACNICEIFDGCDVCAVLEVCSILDGCNIQ